MNNKATFLKELKENRWEIKGSFEDMLLLTKDSIDTTLNGGVEVVNLTESGNYIRDNYAILYYLNSQNLNLIPGESENVDGYEVIKKLRRLTFGHLNCYLDGDTNIKDIKQLRKKYKTK